jgi:hypothetical protein
MQRIWIRNRRDKMTSKDHDEGFVEGYKVGMTTAFQFVRRYCDDYEDEISATYRALEKKKQKG